MNHILNFPPTLISSALIPFLTIDDVVRIDSAVTNHLLRDQLLNLYPQIRVQHSTQGLGPAQIMWFFEKSIPFEELKFTDDLISINLSNIFDFLKIQYMHASLIKEIDFSATYKYAKTAHYNKMLMCCTGLESVNLSRCKDVTKSLLIRLGTECPNLRSLDVSDTTVTDSAVMALAQICSTLTSLNISSCPNITDKSVVIIAQKSLRLNKLYLRQNDRVTNSTICAVAKSCPALTALDVSYCPKITDSALIFTSQTCRYLVRLNVMGCENVSEETRMNFSLKKAW